MDFNWEKVRRYSFMIGIVSIILSVLFMWYFPDMADNARTTIVLVGLAFCVSFLFLLGCCGYAMSKGYSCIIGILLGVSNILGILVLVLLPDINAMNRERDMIDSVTKG